MIKCPNCGSTAQTELMCQPFVSRQTKMLTEGWRCSCGARYTVEYERNEEGKWVYNTTFIDYFAKEGD